MEPPSTGYAAKDVAPGASPSAPRLRRAALSARVSAHELRVPPRRVVDQRSLPCCVSAALSGAMETLDARWPALSPLFHYHVARFAERRSDAEGFLYLADALQTLAAGGICARSLHDPPFTPPGAEARPSPAAFADARTRALPRRGVTSRILQGGPGSRAVWVREQIDRERPVVVGFQLPATYPKSFLDARHQWLDPEAQPRSAANHCVVAVGYDDARRAVHVQDSRGAGAFAGGRWWMGYRVLDSTVVHEMYSLVP